MLLATIFDIDGTLIDSVDLHALAWHEAFAKFGHDVGFEQARSQIGKGGDKLLPNFLSDAEIKDHGEALEAWRGDLFKARYLKLVRPFSAVPDLLHQLKARGTRVAAASSAKQDELEVYLEIAGISDLIDVTVSSSDVQQSKPAPDVFDVALKKLNVESRLAIAISDSPYDVEAAGKAGVDTIGLLSGGFAEQVLRDAGCVAVYTGPAGLFANFNASRLSV